MSWRAQLHALIPRLRGGLSCLEEKRLDQIHVTAAKPVAVRLGYSGSGRGRAGRDRGLIRDGEPGPQIVPEAQTELGTGLQPGPEGVPAIPPGVAAGSAADLAPDDLGADVVLRSVGVQRDLRAVEHAQQLGLVGVQPREQPVQDDKAGPTPKEPIKPRPQFAPSSRGRLALVSLEVAVEPPDQGPRYCCALRW